jgi:hypothetical protein
MASWPRNGRHHREGSHPNLTKKRQSRPDRLLNRLLMALMDWKTHLKGPLDGASKLSPVEAPTVLCWLALLPKKDLACLQAKQSPATFSNHA